MTSELCCPECGGVGTIITGHRTGHNQQLICSVDECTWETYVRRVQTRAERAKVHEILGVPWTSPKTGDGEE